MVSNKIKQKMNLYARGQYAPEKRKVEKSDIPKYQNRDESWETPEASSSDRIIKSRKEPQKKKMTTSAHFIGTKPVDLAVHGEEIKAEPKKKPRKRGRPKKVDAVK